MGFVSFGHGVLIGYLRMNEDFEDPTPTRPQIVLEKSDPMPDNLYFDGLLSLLWLPMTQQKSKLKPKTDNTENKFIDQVDFSEMVNEIRNILARRIN